MNSSRFIIWIAWAWKTTIAEALSKELSMPWADLDELVLQTQHHWGEEVLDDVIKRVGWLKEFRSLENNTLKMLLTQKDVSRVISLGWGAPTFELTKHTITSTGFPIIHVTAPEELLWERIQQDMKSGNNRAGITREILRQRISDRMALYNTLATITVENTWTPQECVKKILSSLEKSPSD